MLLVRGVHSESRERHCTMSPVTAGAVFLLLLLAPAGASEAKPPSMRPAHTKQLSADNFDAFISNSIKKRKVVFVRWMRSDNSEGDCTWVGHGAPYLGDDTETEADPTDRHQSHFFHLRKSMKDNPCAILRQQAELWNEVTKQYQNDPKVIFGEVVLSDHRDLVEQTKGKYTPDKYDDETGDRIKSAVKYSTKFEEELARQAHDVHHDSEHPQGCSITVYSKKRASEDFHYSSHCIDLLEPLHYPMNFDENGEEEKPSAAEKRRREANKHERYFHEMVRDEL